MIKKTAVILAILISYAYAQSPTFGWVKQMGDGARSLATDQSGNVISVGYFSSTQDFDPGSGVANLTSNGNEDIYISKLDPSGNYIWARSLGGTLKDQPYSVDTDPQGNVYIAGYFDSTVDFDPGSGTFQMTTDGVTDAFVLKLDPSGNFQWAVKYGSPFNDYGHNLTVDASGNVYTTGEFAGVVDFDPGTGTYTLNAGNQWNTFVTKLNANGNFVWARNIDGSRGYAIDLDNSGNVYFVGVFWGIRDFDPGPGTYTLDGGQSLGDGYVAKFDPSGNFIWALDFTYSPGNINCDQNGDIVISGSYGYCDFDPGSGTYALNSVGGPDAFIQKLSGTGNFKWAIGFGDQYTDFIQRTALDNFGNIYSTGSFQLTPDFDPGAGVTSFASWDGYDIFITRFSPNGQLTWAGHLGNNSTGAGSGIEIDPFGNIFAAGWCNGLGNYDPIGYNVILGTQDGSDAYVLKLGQPGLNLEKPFAINEGIWLYPNPSQGFISVKHLRTRTRL